MKSTFDAFYEIMQNSFTKIGKVRSKRKEIQLNEGQATKKCSDEYCHVTIDIRRTGRRRTSG